MRDKGVDLNRGEGMGGKIEMDREERSGGEDVDGIG